MGAYETFNLILNNDILTSSELKYCFVGKGKIPYRQDGLKASPDNDSDFVEFDKLNLDNIFDYEGLGISVHASNIFAIDVDHCFDIPFDPNSGDERAEDIINHFKNLAYIEFSFSGTGLRILFKRDGAGIIQDYEQKYYIKNSKNEIEFYQPTSKSYRYVTITGRTLYNNKLMDCPDLILFDFLDNYMLRPKKVEKNQNINYIENRDFKELMEITKTHYRINTLFQNVWFSKAPGANSDESERDFYLISYIFQNITKDKELIKRIFEESPFFKSKDPEHKRKWYYRDYRYFEYMFSHLE